MKTRRLISPLLLVFLAACSAGGGGGGSANPPAPSTGNTSSPYYMPMAQGNTWSFTNGAKIVDMGTLSTSGCGCLATSMERLALYGPGSNAINGSFFFTKNTPAGGTQLTNILGVENDAGITNITFLAPLGFLYGVPIMDDSPTKYETWSNSIGDDSTITSTGGSLTLANGSIIDDVAIDEVSTIGGTLTWGFAKGVGLTQVGAGSTTIQISSFSINAQNSSSITRKPETLPVGRGHIGRLDVANLMRALVENAAAPR